WNRSCPRWAATSDAAVAGSSALLMWSILTSTSLRSPHCLTSVLSSHWSYAGTKCAHCMIERLPFSCRCRCFSTPGNELARSAIPPNMLTAKAPAAPRLTRSRLVSPAFSSAIPPSFLPYALAEGTTRESLDEAVEERVVEQRERDARDQHRRHQRLPEEDVAADQLVRHSGGERPLAGRLREGERVDELVHAQREREDHDGQDPRQGDRENDAPQRAQARAAVDERGVLELLGNRLEEPHQQPRRERDRKRGVDEDHRPERVLQVELGDQPRERQEEQRRGDEIDEEDPDAHRLAQAAGEAREGVAGRQ